MKAYWGVDAQIHALTSALDGSGQLHTQGRSSWCPMDRRLGGPQDRSGHIGEEKNSQPLPGLESLIIKPATQCYTTKLTYIF
jgi:hypothetical protein